MKRKIVLLISLILTAIMSFAFTACVTNGDTDNSASTSYLYSFTLLDDNGDVVVGEATFSAEGREDVSALIINGVTKKVSLFFDTTYTITVEGYEPGTVTIDADGYESAKQITLVKIVPRVTLNVTATDQTGAVLDAIVTPSAPNNNYVIGETYTVTVDGYDGQEFTFVADSSANVDFVFVRYATLNVTAIDTKGDSVTDIVITDGNGDEITNGVYVYGETYYVTSESYDGQTEEFVAGDVDVEVEFIKYVTLNVTAFNQLDEELDVIITDSEGVAVTNGVFVYGDTYTVTVDGYDGQTEEFVAGEVDVEVEFIKYVIATINVTNQDDVPLVPIVRDAGGYDVEPVEGNANQFKLVAGDAYFVGVTGTDDEYEFSLTEDGTVEHAFTLVITTVELNVVAKDQTGATLTAIVTPAVENNIYTIGETYTVTVDGYEGQSFEFVAAPGIDVEFDEFITYVTLSVVAKDQTGATLTAVVTPSVTDNKYVVGTTYTVTVDGYENQSFTFTAEEGADVVFDDFVKYATLNVVAKDQTGATLTAVVTPSVTDNKYVVGTTYTVTVDGYEGQSFEFVAAPGVDVEFDGFITYVTLSVVAKDQTDATLTAVVTPSVTDNKYVVGTTYTVTVDGYEGQSFTFTAEEGVDVVFDEFVKYATLNVVAKDQTGATLTAVVTPSVTDNKYVVGTTYTVTVDGYENQSFTFTASEGVDVVFDDFVKYATLNVVAKDQTAASVTDIVIKDGEGNEITNGVYVYGETYYVTSVSYDGQTKEFVAGDIDVVIDFTLYVTVTITAVDQNNNEVVATIEGVDGYKLVVGNDYTVVAEGCKGSFTFTASKDVTTYNYNFFTNDTDEYSITLIDNLGAKLTGEVTFTANGAYNPSVTLEDGVATVVLEYNKTYVVSLNSNYFTANVVVDASGDIDTTTVTLYRKIIDASSHADLTYVNDTISYNGLSDTKDIALIDTDRVYAEMIISHSLPAGSTETFGVGIKLAATSGNLTYGTRFVQAGHGDNKSGKNEWQLRKMNGDWAYYLIPGSEDKLAVTYKLVVAIKGTTVYAYILDVETGVTLVSMTHTDSNYKAFNMISFYDTTSNTVVSDIKLYNYIPENAIEYIEGSNTAKEDYVVNVAPTVATYGQDNTIEIAPVEGKAITSVVVKNATYTTDVNDGVWTIVLQPSAYGQKVLVTVTTEDIVTASVTLPEENDFYTVTANSTITTGYKLNITVTPKLETTVITAIYVDGVKVADGASATFLKLNNATNHVITVTYNNSAAKVTLTLKTDGITNPLEDTTYLSSGSAVTFTSGDGTIVNSTVGANGVVIALIPYGDWTISVPNSYYRTATFAVNDVATLALEKVMVYEMFENSAQTDAYIAGNGSFNLTERAVLKGIDTNKDIIYTEMTIKAATAVTSFGSGSDCGGAFIEAKGQRKYSDTDIVNDKDFTWGTLQKTVATDANDATTATWSIRWGMAQWNDSPCNSTRFEEWGLKQRYATVGIKIAVLIRNGYMWVMADNGAGEPILLDAWNGGGTGVEYIRAINRNQNTVVSNIKFSRTYAALANTGNKVFSDTTEYNGFGTADGITVTDNGNNNYDIKGTAGVKTSVGSKLVDSSFVASQNSSGNTIGANTYNFDENSEFIITFRMALNTAQGSGGYYPKVALRNAWWTQAVELTSWNNYVDLKYNGTKIKTIYKNDGTALHGLTVEEVDGVTYINFTCVWKSDEKGYSAIYEADGTTLIYTCATATTALTKCRITGSDLVVEVAGSSNDKILDWGINITVKL